MKTEARPQMEVEDYIPHRGRMKLIQEVLESGPGQALCRARVPDHWPLVEDGRAAPEIMVELVAQAAGTVGGWTREGPGRTGTGMIVGIKQARLHAPWLAVGDQLLIRVSADYQGEDFGVFTGRVIRDEEVLGEVEVQVLRHVDPLEDQA